MKIVNYIERHNFCFNDLLNKFYRTEIQTYKVEEGTFGISCKRSSTLIFRLRMTVLNTPKNPYLNQGKILATFS